MNRSAIEIVTAPPSRRVTGSGDGFGFNLRSRQVSLITERRPHSHTLEVFDLQDLESVTMWPNGEPKTPAPVHVGPSPDLGGPDAKTRSAGCVNMDAYCGTCWPHFFQAFDAGRKSFLRSA